MKIKLKKAVLEKFIEKYILSSSIQKVKLEVVNKELFTNFMSEQKTIIGKINLKDFDCEDLKCFINDSSQLVKFLSALSSDVEIEFIKIPNGEIRTIKLSDSVKNIFFTVQDLSNSPAVPPLKSLPKFEVKIDVTPDLIDNFIKSKAALDYQTFFVMKDEEDEKIKFVIASSLTENSNQISVDTGVVLKEEFKTAKYDSNYLKEILNANKKALQGTISISSRGMIYSSFVEGDYTSEYFLLPMAETK